MFSFVPPTIPRPTVRLSKGKKAKRLVGKWLSVEFCSVQNQSIFCTICSLHLHQHLVAYWMRLISSTDQEQYFQCQFGNTFTIINLADTDVKNNKQTRATAFELTSHVEKIFTLLYLIELRCSKLYCLV